MAEEWFVLSVMIVAYSLWRLYRREPWAAKTLDSGGIRLRNLLTGARSYVPFSVVASIDVVDGNGIVLRDRRQAVLAKIFRSTPEECGRVMNQLPQFSGRPLGTCAALSRGGLELESWLDRLRRLAIQRGPYRETKLEPDQALAVVKDARAPVAERAAALYFLACTGRRPSEVLAISSQDSPPLLAVVASLAPGGEELVPLAEDLVRYLPPADQASFDRARESNPRTP